MTKSINSDLIGSNNPVSGTDSSRIHSKNLIKDGPKVNSGTFSSRAKQHACLKANRKKPTNKIADVSKVDISEKHARTTIRRGKKVVKDITPKTPMNDMYRGKSKFNRHGLQQSNRKTEGTPNVGSKCRTRGRSTVTGVYEKTRLFNQDGTINESNISDDKQSQNEDNVSRIKALFMMFKKNHDQI